MAVAKGKMSVDEIGAAVSTAILADINKEFGKGSALPLSDGGLSIHIPGVIPTGSPWLDWALGRGGWPLGRIVLLGGDEGTGKTTLALQACASVQAMGGVAFYIDAEWKLDMDYADMLSVDVDRLIMSQPKYMERALSTIERAIKKISEMRTVLGYRVPVLVVFHSISAIPPKAELEGDYEDHQIGLAARQMGKGLRKIVQLVSQESVCLMLISQMREKIGVMFGDNTTTSCGKAPRFYAATIVNMSAGKGQKAEGSKTRTGVITHVYINKNQVAPPHRKSELHIVYGEGIDRIHGLHGVAPKCGFAKLSGSWLNPPSASGISKWQGENGLRKLPGKAQDRIETAVRKHYGATDWKIPK